MHYVSTRIDSNQTAVDEAAVPTEQEDQTGGGDHADLAPPQGTSTLVIEQFSIGSPGMPIPDKPQASSVYESWRAASMDSPWAPFRSKVDWTIARWVKMRGSTSTAVAELLTMPGVCVSHQLYSMCLTQVH
jgi:hypothetical protein